MNPMPFDFDFMVQPTATFFTSHQVELVLSLLEEHVHPISIPGYVRRRYSGVDLTVQDVNAIKYGQFHVSGSEFHVRMLNSSNLIAIDVVDDFFQLLPTVPSLHCIRGYIEEEYGFVIDDSDLVDLYDGAFHVAGPKTIDSTTKRKFFVPRSDSSEAVWMFERGCSTTFLSQYVWYRFGSHLPAQEVIALSVASQEEIARDAALNYIVSSAPPPPGSIPTCLKQTARRGPPPPPIITSGSPRPKKGLYAVQSQGGTYTANPAVLCHHEDGSYTLLDDLEPTPDYECHVPSDSSTSPSSVHSCTLLSTDSDEDPAYSDSGRLDPIHWTSDEDMSYSDLDSDSDLDSADYSMISSESSRVLVHLRDGDYLINLDQPDHEWIRVPDHRPFGSTPLEDDLPWFPGSAERYFDTPSAMFRWAMDVETDNETHSPQAHGFGEVMLTANQDDLFSLLDSEEKDLDIILGSAHMDVDSEEDLVLDELDIMSPLRHVEGQILQPDQELADLPTLVTTILRQLNSESDAEPLSPVSISMGTPIFFDQDLESAAINEGIGLGNADDHLDGTKVQLDLESRTRNHFLQPPSPKRRSSLGCGRRM